MTQKTFLLIHGAWHGGWCWRRVVDLLAARGHRVFAPTMTGLGERSHLMSASINLDTHIADIVNVITWEDISDICLVAHSYAGWPSSGAIERVPERISSIVWLDAFKPENGQRWYDLTNEQGRASIDSVIANGEPSRPKPKAAMSHVNEKDQAWVDAKMTPQPVGVSMQPIKLTGARERVAKKTYIRAPLYPQPTFDAAYAACKADKTWRALQATCGHDVMVDEPEWLVKVLLETAGA